MAESLKCVFCINSGDKLILFSDETLKCKNILKLRKEHNLKFKDNTLAVELYESVIIGSVINPLQD